MSITIAIEKAKETLNKHSAYGKLPINISKIVKKEGLNVVSYDFESNVSGALIIDKEGNATIGVNPSENKRRKRFTLAHELGHYLLHKSNKKLLFVDDKKFLGSELHYRNELSSIGLISEEKEANAFAAELLMPQASIESEIKKIQSNDGAYTDEKLIKQLADTFDVSVVAMTFRLANIS